ncbi:MAG: twin-arginine translocation signal domain-containing protein [Geminicoccaceae bacterium]
MSKRILDRRQFLKSAATTAAVVAAAGGTTTILASNKSWAMDLNVLGQHEAEVLLKMTRALYPHDRFGDVYYAEVVEALDEKAKADGSIAGLVKDGVAQLDGALGVPFLELSLGTQTEVLKTMETTPFFQTVRGHTVVALYNNQNVWADLGYQGSSYQDGGYLFRGFQDAGWTMQPDEEASPAPFLG